MASELKINRWLVSFIAGLFLVCVGCHTAVFSRCDSGIGCQTDIRQKQPWTIGENAVFRPPCGPDGEFFGARATSWREWPASGAEWRDQSVLYPTVTDADYSGFRSGDAAEFEVPLQNAEELPSTGFPDHSDAEPKHNPIDNLRPPEIPEDFSPPPPSGVEPSYDDNQGSFRFREPPVAELPVEGLAVEEKPFVADELPIENELLGDPPLPESPGFN